MGSMSETESEESDEVLRLGDSGGVLRVGESGGEG